MDLTGAIWRKSSRSSTNGGDCVEVADNVAVRDSRGPEGPMLVFARDQWLSFIADVKDGRFDA
jgi:hypothetical protein